MMSNKVLFNDTLFVFKFSYLKYDSKHIIHYAQNQKKQHQISTQSTESRNDTLLLL